MLVAHSGLSVFNNNVNTVVTFKDEKAGKFILQKLVSLTFHLTIGRFDE